MRISSKFVVALFLSIFSITTFGAQVQEDPLERQVLEIAKELRCAVCQNQSVAESNADLARDMRAIIREQLQAGKSKPEIEQYFVNRYGNYILMKPPAEGPGAMLWVMPALFAVMLAFTAFFYLKQRRRGSLPTAPTLSAKDRALVDRARADNQ